MANDKNEAKGWGGPGRGQGRTAPAAAGAVSRRNVTLDVASVEILRRAGDGDLSRGIRLAAQLMDDDTHGILLSQTDGKWQVVNGRQRLLVQLELHGFATALTTAGNIVRVERDEAGELRCVVP